VTSRFLVVLALALVGCSERRIPDFHGVRLGMTPREVRDRFDVHGDFAVAPAAANDDVTMRFSPIAAPAAQQVTVAEQVTVTSAQFEFHMGVLVAVRADVTAPDAASSGDATVATRAEVLHRERKDGGAHIDWLSRECPTHTAEANRLARAAGK